MADTGAILPGNVVYFSYSMESRYTDRFLNDSQYLSDVAIRSSNLIINQFDFSSLSSISNLRITGFRFAVNYNVAYNNVSNNSLKLQFCHGLTQGSSAKTTIGNEITRVKGNTGQETWEYVSGSGDSSAITWMNNNLSKVLAGTDFGVFASFENLTRLYSVKLALVYETVTNYTISTAVSPSGGGTVTGGGTYANGTSVTLTASPAANYHFVSWNDGNTNASRSITVSANATYTATFALDTHTITTAVSGSGSVSGGGTYNHGSTVTLTASPATGYQFTSWNDGVTTASRSITVTANATYTATFAPNVYTINVTTGDGSASVSGGGQYSYGETVTITATPGPHEHFARWEEDGNTSASRTITVTGDATYTAIFEYNQYTVNVASNDISLGTVSGGGTFVYNSNVVITASPANGCHFVQWSNGSDEAEFTVIVFEDVTYTAFFAVNQYSITVSASPSGGGTVTGGGTYNSGTSVTLTATPATGYDFVSWNDGNTSATRIFTGTLDTAFTATFALKTYTIYLRDDDNNSLGSVTVSHGSVPVISKMPTKEPSGGATFTFREWNTAQDGSGTSYTLNGLPAATVSTTYYAQFDVSYDTAKIVSVTMTPNPVNAGQGYVITVVFEGEEEEEEDMAYRIPFTITMGDNGLEATTTASFADARTAVANDRIVDAKIDVMGAFTLYAPCSARIDSSGTIVGLIFSKTVPIEGTPSHFSITWTASGATPEAYELQTAEEE